MRTNALSGPGDCAFSTKVRHSAFYATPLEYVLQREQVAAFDAYVRHLAIKIPKGTVPARSAGA
jgi:hypothetical protein